MAANINPSLKDMLEPLTIGLSEWQRKFAWNRISSLRAYKFDSEENLNLRLREIVKVLSNSGAFSGRDRLKEIYERLRKNENSDEAPEKVLRMCGIGVSKLTPLSVALYLDRTNRYYGETYWAIWERVHPKA